MRPAIIVITIAAALGGVGTLALANTRPERVPEKVDVIEGKDRPILLGRMVVAATPLSE